LERLTKAAEEHNAENLLVVRSPELAAKYAGNWKAHAKHSDAYQGYGDDTVPVEKNPRKQVSGQSNAVSGTSGPISWRPVRISETDTGLHSGRKNEAFLHESK